MLKRLAEITPNDSSKPTGKKTEHRKGFMFLRKDFGFPLDYPRFGIVNRRGSNGQISSKYFVSFYG